MPLVVRACRRLQNRRDVAVHSHCLAIREINGIASQRRRVRMREVVLTSGVQRLIGRAREVDRVQPRTIIANRVRTTELIVRVIDHDGFIYLGSRCTKDHTVRPLVNTCDTLVIDLDLNGCRVNTVKCDTRFVHVGTLDDFSCIERIWECHRTGDRC